MRKIYDWDGWFGSGAFALVRGEDFACSMSAMVQQIRSAASIRGIHVSIAEGEQTIQVKVVEEVPHASHR